MIRAIKAGVISVYNRIVPLAGTTDRKIFNLVPFLYFSYLSPDRGREMATLATLGLKGRLVQVKEPFIQWIKKLHRPSTVEIATNDPGYILVGSHMPDLINKVIVAVAFCTGLSFYASLTNLLSYSEKVSKIAQPILDRVSSLPILRLLPSARVVAFAPVIAKLIHMALIYRDPKGESKVLEALKTGANRASQGLEFLWNLRFSLLCLGISKTVYQSVGLTIYNQLVKRVISDKDIKRTLSLLSNNSPSISDKAVKDFKSFLNILPNISSLLIRQSLLPNAAPTTWNQFLIFCSSNDYLPTMGLDLGVDGMLTSLQASSDPSNTEVLEKLFTDADSLKWDINNLVEFQSSIETIKSAIALALSKREISETHASSLYELVNDKIRASLGDFVLDPQFASLFDGKDKIKLFKAIYCQQHSEDQATKFTVFFKELSQLQVHTRDIFNTRGPFDLAEQLDDIINTMNQLLDSKSITSLQKQACQEFLFREIEQSFNNVIIPTLFVGDVHEISQQLDKANTYLSFCTRTLGNCTTQVNALRSSILKKFTQKFLPILNSKDLLDAEYEATMAALFRQGGIIHQFAVTPEEVYSTYLISTQILLRRFELNFNWYFANPSDTPEKRKVELSLLLLSGKVTK